MYVYNEQCSATNVVLFIFCRMKMRRRMELIALRYNVHVHVVYM